MNVVFVIDSLGCGGAEKGLVTLLSSMDYSKYKVDLLLLKRGGMFESMVPRQVHILDGLDYARFTLIPLSLLCYESICKCEFRRLLARIRFSIARRFASRKVHGAQTFWERMGSLIQSNAVQYDVAIAFSQGFPTYYVAEKIKALRRIAVVNTDYVAAGYSRIHDVQFYRKYDKIIVDGEHGQAVMKGEYPDLAGKLEVIRDIVSPTILQQMADAGETFQDGFAGVRVLTIGRLAAPKGYDIALDACCKLRQKGIKFRWYVIGEGPLRRTIEDYVRRNELSEQFVLLGFRMNPYRFLKDCDIYVQTSKFEGYGTTIVEARLLNKPIVTTNFQVVYEQIENGRNGLIVEMNAEAVCAGVLQLIGDEGRMMRMVESLRSEKKGTLEDVVKWIQVIGAADKSAAS